MYQVSSNLAKNRLYLKLDGFMSETEAHEAANTLIAETRKLKPGYDIISDIAGFKPMSPEGAKEIERGQKFVAQNGVRHIMRVVGSNVIGRMQFQRTAKAVGSNTLTEEVASLEEAEHRLDELMAVGLFSHPKT